MPGKKPTKCTLTTISPIHIGGTRQAVSDHKFVLRGDACYFVNEEAFARFLVERGLDSDYLTFVQEKKEGGLTGFLQAVDSGSGSLWNASSLEAFSLFRSKRVGGARADKVPTEIRTFLRDAYQTPYIPASSIKGAIRTAVLYSMVKNNRRLLKDKTKDSDIVEKTLQGFGLKDNPARKLERSLRDIMQTVEISDALPQALDESSLELNRVHVVNTKAGEGKSPEVLGLFLWVETVPAGCSFTFDLKVDSEIFRKVFQAAENRKNTFPFEDKTQLMKILSEFSGKIMEEEQAFYQSLAPNELAKLSPQIKSMLESPGLGKGYSKVQGGQPNLRIGWGGGMMGATLLSLMAPKDRLAIKEKVNSEKPGRFKGDYPYDFPRSRKVIVEVNDGGDPIPISPLGWCKITE